MQSVIILGKEKQAREEAESIIRQNKISKFDVHTFASEKAIGIPDIRLLQKDIFLKPGFSEKKAIVIETFNSITVDAQNAFLKTLEEPPQSTIILILTKNLDYFLPTVLSRCNLITIKPNKKSTTEDTSYLQLLISVLENKENPLVIAQDYSKDKNTALDFLENLIIAAEANLEIDKSMKKALKDLQKTYTTIKTTNVSPRFALENLLLNL